MPGTTSFSARPWALLSAALFLLQTGCSACENEPAQRQLEPEAEQPVREAREDSAPEVAVWLTSGDGEYLLEQRPPLFFGQDTAGGEHLTVTVDEERTYQVMHGVGAALTDSAAWLMAERMSQEQREALLQRLFAYPDGIGLSVVRHPVGSSDFALSTYTFGDVPTGEEDPELTRFSVDRDRAYTIPLLRRMEEINGELRVIGTPWSAPAWMKNSGTLVGGSLRPEAYDAYAEYLVRYIEGFASEGVTVDSITPQNEPLFEPSGYPGMRMEAAEQAAFIANHLGPKLTARAPGTEIWIFDHNWADAEYPIRVLEDAQARQYVTGTAFHCYEGEVARQSEVHEAYPEKAILISECTGLMGSSFGPDLVWTMRNLFIGGIRNWASSVLFWNLALDESAGPQNGGCVNCRGVVTIDQGTGDVTYNVEFYALAHASLAFRPSARRIESTSWENQVESVAFLNPDGTKGLLVANTQPNPQSIKVRWSGRAFTYELPPQSAATFTWR